MLRARLPDRAAGNAALELLILAPVVLMLVGLVIAAGRTAVAQGSVDAAARDAARQASIARSAEAARRDAYTAARQTLAQQGLQCAQLSVRVDTSGFAVPVGTPASVSASVECTVRLADVAVRGLPGARTVRAHFTSALDTYRERG
jgi:Flp pilus assembly protein TadG